MTTTRYVLLDSDDYAIIDPDLNLSEFASDNDMTDAEAEAMRDELARSGRFWVGGGAAPLYMVKRVSGVSP